MTPPSARAVFIDSPLPYGEAVALQERLVARRQQDLDPDTILFLEHEPVVTLGRRGRDEFVLAPRAELARRGIAFHTASRGGDVTYHGPGQLVLYPILRLGAAEADAHRHLWNLEEIALRTCADFGVRAFRREGMSGAWADDGKLAAIGFRLKRWISLHGMSFNVDLDLSAFDLIVGCGLVGQPVTSLKRILGARAPTLPMVRERMAAHCADVLGRVLTPMPWTELQRVAGGSAE